MSLRMVLAACAAASFYVGPLLVVARGQEHEPIILGTPVCWLEPATHESFAAFSLLLALSRLCIFLTCTLSCRLSECYYTCSYKGNQISHQCQCHGQSRWHFSSFHAVVVLLHYLEPLESCKPDLSASP